MSASRLFVAAFVWAAACALWADIIRPGAIPLRLTTGAPIHTMPD